MTARSPQVGLRHAESFRVEARHTVPGVSPDWPGFADMPPVLATAMMIGFIEQTCVQGLRPFLASGQATVGVHVDISHSAATRPGLNVTAQVELIAIEGRTLTFAVKASDDAGLIGEGLHRRAVIEVERFLARLPPAP